MKAVGVATVMAQPTESDRAGSSRRATCRRQLVVFLAATVVVSAIYEAVLIWQGGVQSLGMLGIFGLMWIPALVSIVMRLAYREGFRDVGWRLGPLRYWAWSYFGPAGCALFTYGGAWLVGAVVFSVPAEVAPRLQGVSPHLAWAGANVAVLTIGFAIGAFAAFGEELGWRGYMLTRLVEAELPAPLLLSGVIWGVWHVPLIIWGDYATSSYPWLSALLFIVCITFASVFVGWLRLAGGSVWVAVIMHASHNSYYQSVFDYWFTGELEPYLAGEAGLFSIVAYGAIVLWLWRSGRWRSCLKSPVLFARPKRKPTSE